MGQSCTVRVENINFNVIIEKMCVEMHYLLVARLFELVAKFFAVLCYLLLAAED